MNSKEFLVAFLGKTLNMPADKVASLYTNDEGTEFKPESLDEILKLDVSRVEALNKKQFENGQKKATKEIMSDFEKSLREKFDLESEKKGLELIEELIQIKAAPSEIEANKVKLHPEYLGLEKRLNDAVKAKEKEWKEKYENYEKQVSRKETLSSVFSKADALLSEFDLPKDDKLKANQKKLLKDELEKYGYQVNGEELIVLDAEGNPVTDGHGARKNFDEVVKGIAGNYWPKLNGQSRSGSGASNDTGGAGQSGKGWKGKIPTSEAEYSEVFATLKTAEERIAFTDAYEAAQGSKV